MKSYKLGTSIAVVSLALVYVTSASSVNGVPLFGYETQRLEGPGTSKYAKLFAFDTPGPTIKSGECKPRPGDSAWPSQEVWDDFDKALGGALIRTVPLAAPCYDNWGSYDSEKCMSITNNWTNPYLHENDPTSVMWPLWEGRSCVPTDDPANSTCALGAFPVYAVNATNVAQIQLAVNFARNQGLRLVIKNTGHDYQGRSTGAGALSIWTHNLQGLNYLPKYALGKFSGKALHVGAGIVTQDIAAMAEDHDGSVVGGMCASVGFAGGYYAGGGHSPLSSLFGLAADHVLAIHAVTADGRFVTATEKAHPDLFWALRGGGGSTFAVTTSVIVRVHPKIQVVTSQFSFQTSPSISNETFWEGVRVFFENFDRMTKAGFYAYTNIRRDSPFYGNSSYSLACEPMMAPNNSIETFTRIMKPVFDRLDKLGIPYQNSPKYFTSYYAAWTDSWPGSQLKVTQPEGIEASRLFPRGVWNDPSGFETSFSAIKGVINDGYDITAFGIAPGNPFNVDNAVNPALRHLMAYISTGILLPPNPTPAQLAAAQSKVMNDLLQPWREAAPADKFGGSYANEGNVMEPNWQQDFYGDKYPKLLRIKQKWDPSSLFYATAGVGTEGWEVRTKDRGIQTQNGPLCRL